MGQLYLHETLDPVRAPGAHTRYLDELGNVVRTMGNAEDRPAGNASPPGCRCFSPATGRALSQFWEMPGGWDGFGRHFDGNGDLFHRPLERWYGERSGGFDRVLEGTDYTPSRDRDGRDRPARTGGAAADRIAARGRRQHLSRSSRRCQGRDRQCRRIQRAGWIRAPHSATTPRRWCCGPFPTASGAGAGRTAACRFFRLCALGPLSIAATTSGAATPAWCFAAGDPGRC